LKNSNYNLTLTNINQAVKKGGRNHSLFILNGMQPNTKIYKPTPKSIK